MSLLQRIKTVTSIPSCSTLAYLSRKLQAFARSLTAPATFQHHYAPFLPDSSNTNPKYLNSAFYPQWSFISILPLLLTPSPCPYLHSPSNRPPLFQDTLQQNGVSSFSDFLPILHIMPAHFHAKGQAISIIYSPIKSQKMLIHPSLTQLSSLSLPFNLTQAKYMSWCFPVNSIINNFQVYKVYKHSLLPLSYIFTHLLYSKDLSTHPLCDLKPPC